MVDEHPPSTAVDRAPRRADIQGLRALAILLVVAYHSDVGIDGGFLGVDVFFVVSGFVIGALLVREWSTTGTVRLGAFYARRIRRLVPAFAAMAVVVLIVCVLVLNPYDSQPFAARTAAAAQVFGANFFLYRHVGYFDASAEMNPFLHTWSLSIEEQFYLVFPLALLLVGRVGARRRGVLVAMVAIGGLLSFGVWVAMSNDWWSAGLEAPARFAYFMAPTRAWQFCAGVLVALGWGRWQAAATRARCSAVGVVSLGAVAAAVAASDGTGIDPGFNGSTTLLASIGAAGLIVAGATANPVTAALSVRPAVVIGNHSYAWYLWHWPAVVLVRVLWPTAGWAAGVAAVAAFAPAAASTRWIESPLRRPGVSTGRSLRVGAAAAATTLLVAGVVDTGADRGWGVAVPIDWYDLPVARSTGCNLFNRDIANSWPEERCTTRVPGATGTVLVVGDQQADSASTAVVVAAGRLGLDTATWTRTDCPAFGGSVTRYPRCDDWNDDVLRVVDRLRPNVVVVGNNSPQYVSGDSPVQVATGAGDVATGDDALDRWSRGLDRLITELDERGAAVVLVGPVPDFGRAFSRDRVSVVRPDLAVAPLPVADVRSALGPVVEVERAVAAERSVPYVDPVPILCTDVCEPEHDGRWWWYDAEHLNVLGGRQLVPEMSRALATALRR